MALVGRQRGDRPAQRVALLLSSVLNGGQGSVLGRQSAGDGHAGEGRVGVVEDGEDVGQRLAGQDVVGRVRFDRQHRREDLDDVGRDAGLELELLVVHLADANDGVLVSNLDLFDLQFHLGQFVHVDQRDVTLIVGQIYLVTVGELLDAGGLASDGDEPPRHRRVARSLRNSDLPRLRSIFLTQDDDVILVAARHNLH